MPVADLDRAAAVRQALRTLVAERGFHGASMSAVAAQAGVATGTAYTHYGGKDELVLATYLETKEELGAAAVADLAEEATPEQAFRAIWLAIYRHLAKNRDHARFLMQVDFSPYRETAHAAAMERGDALMERAAESGIVERLLPLPLDVLYDLGLGPAVRLAATGESLTKRELEQVAGACWRAVSRD